MNEYEIAHRVESKVDALASHATALDARLTDIEAERFAEGIALEIDLERWRDGIAANVGHDLENVADKLMDAIVALRRGEDATAKLYDAHMDLCNVIGDLLSMNPEEE